MENTSIRIKEALKIRDMKQSELSKLTGISKGALSSYISGTYEPKQRNIYKIAEALNVNEAWLMGYDVPMERKEKNIIENKSTFNPNVITKKDEKKIQKNLKKYMEELKSGQNGPAFYGDDELDEEDLELIEEAMKFALRTIRLKNKEKYTPKKYKNKK